MGENKLWTFNELLIDKEYSFGKALNPSAIITRSIRPVNGFSYSTPIEEIKMGEPPVPEAGATGIVTSVNPIYENDLVTAYVVKIKVGEYVWTVRKNLPTPGLKYMSPAFKEFMKSNRMFIGPMGNGIGEPIAQSYSPLPASLLLPSVPVVAAASAAPRPSNQLTATQLSALGVTAEEYNALQPGGGRRRRRRRTNRRKSRKNHKRSTRRRR